MVKEIGGIGDRIGGIHKIDDQQIKFARPLGEGQRLVLSLDITERLRMVGKDRFEDVLTIEDPVAFTKPWTVTIPIERAKDLDRMVHGLCDENDRNPVVDGKLTVTLKGDTIAEDFARMLDEYVEKRFGGAATPR